MYQKCLALGVHKFSIHVKLRKQLRLGRALVQILK
jgi:hypothetical protein